MLRDPESHVMEKAYARWAPVYDVLCGPVFVNGRRAAAQVLPSPRLEAQTEIHETLPNLIVAAQIRA
jgi:hypothetical protein